MAAPARSRPLASLALLALLVGCAQPMPLQPGPTVELAAGYRHADSAPASFDAAWWQTFADPSLRDLVARAQAGNHDVLIAAQRLRQARAGLAAAASRLLPTVALNASASNQRSGLPDEVKRGAPDTRALRGALDAGWELDVFGAARAAADAAELDALAASAGVEAAQMLVSAEVARQYFIGQGARLRLQQLQALLQTQRDTERLTRSRHAAGQASAFDVARAAGETQSLAASLPPLQALVAVTEHQLAVLVGTNPSTALPDASSPPAALPEVPPLPAGQPAELLMRRPDLRAARAQLQAEGARLREAEADLWPKFFLAGVLGREDLKLNALDLSPVRYGSIALAFTMPLFNAGRLRAAVERQSARERIASLQYERAVLGALQDVESSLVALAQERERGRSLEAALEQRRIGVRHALSLHREGQIDLLQLLDAQRGLIAAELSTLDSRTQLALDAVQLFKALGGGWQLDAAAPAVAEARSPR